MEIYFATSNLSKFAEAEAFMKKRCPAITLSHFGFSYNEIRSDSLEDIARDAAEEAHRRCAKPVFVEDSGLFINALSGFPGAYSGWVQKKLGNIGILKLLDRAKDRSAYFEACIAYHDGTRISCFAGKCAGSISEKALGKNGFGYDPIFVPEGMVQTFAQNIELKNNLSHRYKSLLEFSKSLSPRG